MPRALKETAQFKADKKRIKGSGRYDWEKMRSVVGELMNDAHWARSIVTLSSRATTKAPENAMSSPTGCSSMTRKVASTQAP
jgi:hypothetical protein